MKNIRVRDLLLLYLRDIKVGVRVVLYHVIIINVQSSLVTNKWKYVNVGTMQRDYFSSLI